VECYFTVVLLFRCTSCASSRFECSWCVQMNRCVSSRRNCPSEAIVTGSAVRPPLPFIQFHTLHVIIVLVLFILYFLAVFCCSNSKPVEFSVEWNEHLSSFVARIFIRPTKLLKA